ncbi:MAG: flagellar hook-basal body protein [Chloroherpetonaceae bacterium]
MLKEFFTAALGMQNQNTRLEVIANNLANANTNGYKSANVFERNLIDASENFNNVSGNVEQNDSPIGSYYDLSAGNYSKTDNPLDIAIDGDGYFLVVDSEGKQYLTRNGAFQLATDGTITTKDGKKLTGEDGEIKISSELFSNPKITQDNKAMNLRVSESGELFLNDSLVGKINIVSPSDPSNLQSVSNGDFILTGNSDMQYLDPNQVKVHQGWLEGSNVNVVNEMVKMIELQRNYEMGGKIIQINDQTLDRSIALGRFI